jgi:hypothetical protein
MEAVFDVPPGAAEFTPAQIEQLCAEHETIEDFAHALGALVKPMIPVQGIKLSRA